VLPLLSQEAYVAFLPAWLNEAIRNPDSSVGTMVLINLSSDPQTSGFTSEQAEVIVEVGRYLVAHNGWGEDDSANVEHLAAIEAAWSF
jgi:hypothetical protein